MGIKEALVRLGQWLDTSTQEIHPVILRAVQRNPWFTRANIEFALKNIRDSFLREEKLQSWMAAYPLPEPDRQKVRVGLIMAGNIPLVGFHDLICVIGSGHIAVVKLSDKDDQLIPALIKKMETWFPEITRKVFFVDRLSDFQAVIATGSNLSAKYFAKYFSGYPHIIRKNRNSVAILTGEETDDELTLLGNDIFSYFGLGCRNVSKIYVPEDFDFARFLAQLNRFKDIADHYKYRNNYDYHLATAIINREKYMSNDCIVLLENKSIASRVAVLHYEFYGDPVVLGRELGLHKEEIQCVVSKSEIPGLIFTPWGSTQQPQLNDYADGIDTMTFLLSLRDANRK
jgi:hypothetical protein